ncbi:MAG: radical SAM protein [Candidatus Omnitrophica bacterium]|nr:radical SAM protein [Candidatus Omnitrophota bacterium]
MNGGDINITFAKQGIKDYFDKAWYPYLRFVALGEPTQNFETLQKLHAYARKCSSGRVKFELQTNGVFNKKIAQWIANNIDEVWISFDGLPEVHDELKRMENNKPTASIILGNLKILQEKTFAGFRATITSLNVRRQKEIVQFAHQQGIKAVFTKVVLPPSNPTLHHTFYKVAQSLQVGMMEYANDFVNAWKLSRELDVFYGNGYINNFDEMCEYACRACLPCPHLTPDGYVSACDRATHGKTPLQEFIYGKYNSVKGVIVYDKEKIAALQSRSVYNMPDCSDCSIKYYCAGGCLGTSSQLAGSMFKITPDYCEAIKYMFENIDWDPRGGLFPYFMT